MVLVAYCHPIPPVSWAKCDIDKPMRKISQKSDVPDESWRDIGYCSQGFIDMWEEGIAQPTEYNPCVKNMSSLVFLEMEKKNAFDIKRKHKSDIRRTCGIFFPLIIWWRPIFCLQNQAMAIFLRYQWPHRTVVATHGFQRCRSFYVWNEQSFYPGNLAIDMRVWLLRQTIHLLLRLL